MLKILGSLSSLINLLSLILTTIELVMQKTYQDRETSPERTMVWVERKSNKEQKVPVVYYLSSNGQLEHPHLLEVPLSSP